MKLKHLKPTETVIDKLRLYKISFCLKKKQQKLSPEAIKN